LIVDGLKKYKLIHHMKIDTDLRAAIRSAEKAQPDKGWQARTEAETKAIAKLLADNKALGGKVRAEIAVIEKASKQMERAGEYLESLGITKSLERIRDHELFVKAGGKVPLMGKRWTFDEVMSKLAAVKTEREGKTILRKYGIHWE
jgi:hypothetical protein